MRRPQQHGSLSPAASWCPRRPDTHRAVSPCPRPRSASACPASTRPGSDVWCLSSVRRPVRPSGVQCLVSDVRCPVHASGIGASGVRVRAVRAGELVERVGAADSDTDRTGRIGVVPPCPRPERGRRRGRRVGGGWVECRGRRGAAGCARGSPVAGQAGEVGSPVAGGAQVGGSVRPTTTWVVGRPGRDALGPRARGCAAPLRPQGSSSPPRSRQTGRGTPL
jgi:hypothetical protein